MLENKVAVIDGTNIPAIMTVTGAPDASSSFGACTRIYLSSPDGTGYRAVCNRRYRMKPCARWCSMIQADSAALL